MTGNEITVRRRSCLLKAVLVIMTTAAWIAAFNAFSRAPNATDLYNIIYHNDRPTKPEATVLFLFVFPAMLAAVTALSVTKHPSFENDGKVVPKGSRREAAFVLIWAGLLLFLTLYRANAVMAVW